MINQIVKILGVSKNSYWNYKKQNRPIVDLLEKYFTEEDLDEFLKTGEIKKLELLKSKTEQIENLKSAILNQAIYSSKIKIKNWVDTYDADENTLSFYITTDLHDYVEGLYQSYLANGVEDNCLFLEQERNSKFYAGLDASEAKNVLLALLKSYEKKITMDKPLSYYVAMYVSDIEAYTILNKPREVFDFEDKHGNIVGLK